MKLIIKYVVILITVTSYMSCGRPIKVLFKSNEVYKTKYLIINQIAENSYQHISFLKTNDFGNVACNGLIVRNQNEAIVFDTPTNDTSATELIKWINNQLQCRIIAIIPTHFHDDCLGGLKAFHDNNISSFANKMTVDLARENKVEIPKNGFTDYISLKIGKRYVEVKYLGEGHTKDNVVGYYADDKVLFGGCLIKELKASKGFLGDANVKTWSKTVEKVKSTFPNVIKIVPGHGTPGDIKLLDYTIKLFSTHQFGEPIFK